MGPCGATRGRQCYRPSRNCDFVFEDNSAVPDRRFGGAKSLFLERRWCVSRQSFYARLCTAPAHVGPRSSHTSVAIRAQASGRVVPRTCPETQQKVYHTQTPQRLLSAGPNSAVPDQRFGDAKSLLLHRKQPPGQPHQFPTSSPQPTLMCRPGRQKWGGRDHT